MLSFCCRSSLDSKSQGLLCSWQPFAFDGVVRKSTEANMRKASRVRTKRSSKRSAFVLSIICCTSGQGHESRRLHPQHGYLSNSHCLLALKALRKSHPLHPPLSAYPILLMNCSRYCRACSLCPQAKAATIKAAGHSRYHNLRASELLHRSAPPIKAQASSRTGFSASQIGQWRPDTPRTLNRARVIGPKNLAHWPTVVRASRRRLSSCVSASCNFRALGVG